MDKAHPSTDQPLAHLVTSTLQRVADSEVAGRYMEVHEQHFIIFTKPLLYILYIYIYFSMMMHVNQGTRLFGERRNSNRRKIGESKCFFGEEWPFPHEGI